jgi:type III secretion protein D
MQNWKIRILSGVHTGVEIPLPSGALVLGSDDYSADVVLSDAGVQSNHLTLESTDESVILSGCSHVMLKGEKIEMPEGGLPIARGMELHVGIVHFVVGYAEDELASMCREDNKIAIDAPAKAVQTSMWKRSLVIGVICSIVPSAILAGIWYSQTSSSNGQVIVAAEPVVQVRNIIQELSLEDVRVEWNGSVQQAILEGYVDDSSQKLHLLRQIDLLGINYKSDLRTMDEIRRGVRFILRNLGYHQVKVENGDEAGTVLLTGYIDDATRWSQVEQILERDVPGLAAWKVELQRAGAYMETLKQMLEKEALLNKVKIVTNGERVEIRGELDDIQTTRFYAVTRKFREQYGDKPYLVLKSIPTVTKGTNIDFPFRSVNFGQVPYVILNDNVRYMVGSRTPQGYRISNVSPEGIELVKSGQTISIDLGYSVDNTNDKS